jgi:hypothetical protein
MQRYAGKNPRIYKKGVWPLMRNSNCDEKQTADVRLYLDESGTRDPGTPIAVVGGIIINRPYEDHFEPEWFKILERHHIEPPIHMREIGPHGKLGWLSGQQRSDLFAELVPLINSHKIASVSATLSNREYEEHCPIEMRGGLSVYGMCFNLAVMINHKLAEQARYEGRIPFILDTGNPYVEHVLGAHAAMMEFQKSDYIHAGCLDFEDDANSAVLQAADVIAWGVRRQESQKSFPPGLEQIAELLLKEQHHHNNEWKSEWLKQLGDWARMASTQHLEAGESNR